MFKCLEVQNVMSKKPDEIQLFRNTQALLLKLSVLQIIKRKNKNYKCIKTKISIDDDYEISIENDTQVINMIQEDTGVFINVYFFCDIDELSILRDENHTNILTDVFTDLYKYSITSDDFKSIQSLNKLNHLLKSKTQLNTNLNVYMFGDLTVNQLWLFNLLSLIGTKQISLRNTPLKDLLEFVSEKNLKIDTLLGLDLIKTYDKPDKHIKKLITHLQDNNSQQLEMNILQTYLSSGSTYANVISFIDAYETNFTDVVNQINVFDDETYKIFVDRLNKYYKNRKVIYNQKSNLVPSQFLQYIFNCNINTIDKNLYNLINYQKDNTCIQFIICVLFNGYFDNKTDIEFVKKISKFKINNNTVVCNLFIDNYKLVTDSIFNNKNKNDLRHKLSIILLWRVIKQIKKNRNLLDDYFDQAEKFEYVNTDFLPTKIKNEFKEDCRIYFARLEGDMYL